MVDRTEALVLQMSADIRKMERALNQARGQTNRQLSEVERRFDRMNAHVRRSGDEMARDLRASIAAIGIGLAIREVTSYADVWTTAQNRLASAGVAQDQLASTMSDLVNLARATRSEFGGTVELYAKLTRAGQQLNLTQAEVRKITETTLQAFVAGGAAASEQAAAVTQLSQALGSGVLQGDELRSIRENAPLLAEAIAKEFNTTIAGLKELGAEGELTADRVARAILNADGIFEAFDRTVATVAQSMENLRTEFTRYIAESRIAQTAVQALSGFIQLVTDNLDLFADAAIVAAGVIGGTLAVAAIGRLLAGLRSVIITVRSAQTAMVGLRAAMTFLGGPVGAVILGIGAAVASMALSTLDSASAADRASDSLEKLGNIRGAITTQTTQLQAAQEKLSQAMREGGEAAQFAAALEVDRIRKLVDGNRALFQLERARAQQALNDRSAEFRTKYVDIPGLSALRGFSRTTLESADFDILTPELRRRRQSIEAFSASIADAARVRNLTDEEKAYAAIAQAILAYREEMRTLTDQVKEFDKVLTDTAPADADLILPFPSADGGRGGTQALSGYRTEMERLAEALDAIRSRGAADEQTFSAMTTAFDSLVDLSDPADPDAVSLIEKRRKELEAFYAAFDEGQLNRSREAIQAVLDFAQSGNLAEAFAQVPNIRDLLAGDDETLVMTELTALAEAAADAVAVGFDRAVLDHQERMAEIARARAAAIAAGIADLSQFERAAAEADAELTRAYDDFVGVENPYDMDALSEEMRGFVDDIEWEVAGEELREVMREAVKNAMREGIRTGDWGDAFALILAEAVTAGLDDALNRIGDFLADVLFSENGFLANLATAASQWAFGPRAGGGAVMAGGRYRINDRGDDGEFLFMGSNPGQVLRQSDIAGHLGNSRGGTTVINANLMVEGSVDSVTWPRVQDAMRQQARQIMSAVPATVNATLIDNRTQKRRF